MILQPIASTINAGEVLWLVAASVFAGVMYWLGRAILETRDKVRQLVQTLYGPPELEGRGGMMAEHEVHGTAIDTLAKEQVRLRDRVQLVERTCKMTHQPIRLGGE